MTEPIILNQRGKKRCRKGWVVDLLVGMLQGRVVRLPVHLHELMAKVTKVDLEYQSEHGCRAGKAKLAELVGISTEKLAMLSKVRDTINTPEAHRLQPMYYQTSVSTATEYL